MKKNKQFQNLLENYLMNHLRIVKNVSSKTILSYRDTFVLLLSYYRDVRHIPAYKMELTDLTKENIEGFLSWLVDEKHYCLNSRNHRLCVIRSFIKYLQYEDVEQIGEWQKILSIPMAKYAVPHMKYLTSDAVKLLLKQPDSSTRQGRRHLAMLAIMCDTGARVQEIIDLKVSSLKISLEPYTVTIVGKGNKTRVVPLLNDQVAILRIYLSEHIKNSIDEEQLPLFLNSQGKKMTRSGITHILNKYVYMANKENPLIMPIHLNCHCLRHTKAMNLLESGVPLHLIRDILGHVSIETTEIYARANVEMKKEALEQAYAKTNPEISISSLWSGDKDTIDWLKSIK